MARKKKVEKVKAPKKAKTKKTTKKVEAPVETPKKVETLGSMHGHEIKRKNTKIVNGKEYIEILLANGTTFLFNENDPEYKAYFKA